MPTPATTVAALWQRCDTVLLDMDGTLLDLSFDNWFWREAVPRCMARARGEPAEQVRVRLFEKFASKQGSLDWYCLDYWSSELQLDLRSIKSAASHRIRFLPGAKHFLHRARASGKRLVLVTNAHADTLKVKQGVCGLAQYFDQCLTSHEFGAPKESAEFWPRLREHLDFDAQRTLFVDDSQAVLDAAEGFGLGGIVAVARPDSRQPARSVHRHQAVHGVGELLGDTAGD